MAVSADQINEWKLMDNIYLASRKLEEATRAVFRDRDLYLRSITTAAKTKPTVLQEPETGSSGIYGYLPSKKTVAIGTAVGVTAVVATPLLISAAGFGVAGVTAGSFAAGFQATLGGVIPAGSTFSLLQSAGVVGTAVTTKAMIGVGGAAVGAGASAAVDKIRGDPLKAKY